MNIKERERMMEDKIFYLFARYAEEINGKLIVRKKDLPTVANICAELGIKKYDTYYKYRNLLMEKGRLIKRDKDFILVDIMEEDIYKYLRRRGKRVISSGEIEDKLGIDYKNIERVMGKLKEKHLVEYEDSYVRYKGKLVKAWKIEKVNEKREIEVGKGR